MTTRRTIAMSCAAVAATAGALALMSIPALPVLASQPEVQDPVKASKGEAPTSKPTPMVDPDVATVDGLVAALYGVISGPKGQMRDWARMRKLFYPDARMVTLAPTRPSKPGARPGAKTRIFGVDDYIEQSGDFLVNNGFFEKEVSRKTEASQVGDHVQLWSRYEGRHAEKDEDPFLEGANGITLVREDGRWWILQIVWQQDS